MGPELNITMNIVGLDWDKLMSKLEEAVSEGMDKLADKIDEVWRDKAAQQLHSTKDKYLQGLTVERVGKDKIQATLTGFLPVALEEGHEQYDMKKGLLGSALSKVIPIGKGAGNAPSFRTMTSTSDGWLHPGFQAKRIHQQVQKEIEEHLTFDVFDPILSKVIV